MASPLGLSFNYSEKGWETQAKQIGSYKIIDNSKVKSLFDNANFSPFPTIGPNTGTDKNGNVNSIRAKNAGDSGINGNDTNDTSIPALVKYCSQYPAMKLSYADFAYLKNVGVYPNNRLMIARRFQSGVTSDLTTLSNTQPMATLITWIKDTEDYISISYNEEWEEAEASFKDILNNIGSDSKLSGESSEKYGDAASGGVSLLPFPGFTEGLQYEVLKRMGLTELGIGNSPMGNPNLIRQAKKRKTIGKEDSGSGLICKFSVKFEVEYEQKFINGVDPAIVYLDILQNALTFGTSDAIFQYSNSYGEGVKGIINDLVSGDIKAITRAITEFVTALTEAITKIGSDLIEKLKQPTPNTGAQGIQGATGSTGPTGSTGSIGSTGLSDFLKNVTTATVGHVVSKYKVKLIGVVNALTGSPSAPWHVTIGNPKKPFFSSGDMLCKDVKVTLGKNLAFNDLPSYIKIEFTLDNARNLGAQEIFQRLNTGKGRSYARIRQSYVEYPDNGTGLTESNQNNNNNNMEKNQNDPIVVSDAQRDSNNNMVNPKDNDI